MKVESWLISTTKSLLKPLLHWMHNPIPKGAMANIDFEYMRISRNRLAETCRQTSILQNKFKDTIVNRFGGLKEASQ